MRQVIKCCYAVGWRFNFYSGRLFTLPALLYFPQDAQIGRLYTNPPNYVGTPNLGVLYQSTDTSLLPSFLSQRKGRMVPRSVENCHIPANFLGRGHAFSWVAVYSLTPALSRREREPQTFLSRREREPQTFLSRRERAPQTFPLPEGEGATNIPLPEGEGATNIPSPSGRGTKGEGREV